MGSNLTIVPFFDVIYENVIEKKEKQVFSEE
jgi:hypothetical protein